VLELDKAIKDGLRREVREETGLDIEPDALTGGCKVTGGELTTSDEVTDFRWADESNIRQLASQAYAVRILDALLASTAPAVRQHDGIRML
jgi:8-oxo-dGTP diphosphatase